jgi:hypothetical protein
MVFQIFVVLIHFGIKIFSGMANIFPNVSFLYNIERDSICTLPITTLSLYIFFIIIYSVLFGKKKKII